MKNLLTIVDCPKKAYYQEKLKEENLKIKGIEFKKCLRNMLRAEGFTYAIKEKAIVEEYFKDYFDCCVMEKEKEEILNILVAQLSRMYEYFFNMKYRLVDVCVCEDIVLDDVNDIHNRVIFDIVFEDVKGTIIPCVINAGKLSFAATSRAKGYITNSPKAYCWWMAANNKKEWKGKPIEIGEIGLRARNEKSNANVVLMGPFGENSNFIHGAFSLEEERNCKDLIDGLIKSNWKKDSVERTCDKNKCSMCTYKSLCHYSPSDIVIKKMKASDKAPKTIEFTDTQKAFINDHEGYIRTIASAGSGKTTCIINRVVSILNEGESDISDMLMITFTEKGVAEMKAKLAYWLGKDSNHSNIHDFNVFTFNGFGNKIISDNYELLGFTKEPRMLDALDSMDIIKEVLDESPNKLSQLLYSNPLIKMFRVEGAVPKMFKFFNEMKKHNIQNVDEMEECNVTWGSSNDDALALEMFESYNKKMKERNVIDYDDQVKLSVQLLKDHPEVAEQYKFQHILVDEAQDTSKEQFELLNLLVAHNGVKSFVVCGDDAQAIYGFRGVDMRYLLDFDKVHPETKDYMLMDNFRSSREIIEVADSVIQMNTNNIKKSMIGHFSGPKPQIIDVGTGLSIAKRMEYEADVIANSIYKKITNGEVKPGEIAVIARTKQELIEISNLLEDYHVPNIVAFPEFYIDSNEVMAIKGLLSVLVGKPEILGIANYLQIFEPEEFENAFDLENLCQTYKAVMEEKVALMSELDKLDYFTNIVNRLKSLPVVKSLLASFEEKELTTLEDMYMYLYRLFLYKGDDSYNAYEENVDAVVLTTAHSAKGREWEYVAVMLGKMMPECTEIKDGKFRRSFVQIYDRFKDPIAAQDTISASQKEREEDTRLLFVAVTRAKKFLTLVY